MKFEQNDLSIILSSTSLSDVFFTEYLPQANGDYIKVYLYINFLSKYNKDIKINDLSKKLDLPLKIIQDALKYWENNNLLIRKNQGYILANIQEIEINKVYKPKITISPEHIQEVSENKHRANAIESINNEFFQGVMSPSWYTDIDLWFKKYSFDEEVMLALFRYCFNKSALNKNYVAVVADAWNKNNIKSFSDLDLYFQKQEKLNVFCREIKKKLRLSRNLSVFEESYVEKWTITYGYDMSIIDLALKKTTSKYNPSFEYIDKLLTDWHERNFKTVDQISKHLDNQKQMPKQTNDKNTKNSNFDQRDYNDLNEFYSNIEE